MVRLMTNSQGVAVCRSRKKLSAHSSSSSSLSLSVSAPLLLACAALSGCEATKANMFSASEAVGLRILSGSPSSSAGRCWSTSSGGQGMSKAETPSKASQSTPVLSRNASLLALSKGCAACVDPDSGVASRLASRMGLKCVLPPAPSHGVACSRPAAPRRREQEEEKRTVSA